MPSPWFLLEKFLQEGPLSGEEDDFSSDEGGSGDQGIGDPIPSPHKPKPPTQGSGRRVKPGMPSKGSTFQRGGDMALGAAGQRSGIEKSKEAGKLLDFVEKYAEYYDGDPNILIDQIKQLDELPSDQVSMRIRSINNVIGKIHSKARQHFKKAFAASLWSQKFPRYSEQEVRAAIKKGKKSDAYQNNAIIRQKVDSLEQSLFSFQDEVEEKFSADPTAKELDSEYSLVVGGRSAARHFGAGLGATAKSGEQGEKGIATIKRPAFGRGEGEVKPKSVSALTPKYASKVGVPEPESDDEEPEKKSAKPASGSSSRRFSMPGVRKPGQKVGSTVKPQRLQSPKDMESDDEIDDFFGNIKEHAVSQSRAIAMDRFARLMFESAAADRSPRWWDDL